MGDGPIARGLARHHPLNRRQALGRLLASVASFGVVGKLSKLGEEDYSWIIGGLSLHSQNQCKHCSWIQSLEFVSDSVLKLTEYHATDFKEYRGCRRQAMNHREHLINA